MKTNVLSKTKQILFSLLGVLSLITVGHAGEAESSKRISLVNVTFRVDMSERVVSPDGVHLPGTFCNWKTDSLAMMPVGNNIYQLTVPCEAGNMEQYKFLNGISWTTGDENVPGTCGVPNGYGGYNRYINVPCQDTVLKLVCFSRCDSCPPRVNITFRVSMAWQTISPEGVHLSGSFNSWDPAVTLLNEVGNGSYYQAVQPLAPGDSIPFKYVNGADISGVELVPAECGVYSDRYNYQRMLVVPSEATVLPVVCFSQCTGDCTVGVESGQAEEASLSQNVPNPFLESSIISYAVPERSTVRLLISDLMGRTIKTLVEKEMEAGQYKVTIFAPDFTQGMYFYRIIIGKSIFTKQMVVLK